MIHFLSLSLLLGFELTYYLLIVQTGIVAHYNSDIIILFPMFFGGVIGTFLSGKSWFTIDNPIYKIIIALLLQLSLSFLYPNFNAVTLFLLGLSVGFMAPLGIYLFKDKQVKELLFALAIAYTVGTYLFTSDADSRVWIAVGSTSIALFSAIVLKGYKVDLDTKNISHTFISYSPLILWILLDSNLFESISRHDDIDIWSHYTYTIIIFHLLGLYVSYFIKTHINKQHILIAILFTVSYIVSYIESAQLLAIVYPFTISYYNVIVFRTLSQELSLKKLAFIMIFVGWIASGLGLGIALTGLLH